MSSNKYSFLRKVEARQHRVREGKAIENDKVTESN